MQVRAVFASLALFCVSVTRAEEPQWLKDARAREGKPIAATAFKSQDGWLSGTVPARVVGEITKERDSYAVNLDIGAESPVQCEIVPDGFDLADRMHLTLETTMQRVEEAQGKVEARQMEFIDAGAIGNAPYLQARWVLRVNDGKEAHLGALKQIAFEKFGHGIYCAHFDLGYVSTFDSVVRAFAASFQAPPAAPPPYYLEIAVASIGGKKSGVVVTRLERESDGKTKASQLTALLLTEASGVLRTQDALHIDWLKPDGAMVSASHVVSEDGDIVTDVELKQVSDGWMVQGKAAGDRFETKLSNDARPGTWLEQALALRKLLAGGNPIGVESNLALWDAAHVDALTLQKTKVLAKNGPSEYTARLVTETLTSELTLDAKSGRPKIADITTGTQTVHVERVFVSGSF